MPLETVRVSAVLPASADRVYAAWLDSEAHSAMTGSKATVDPSLGGEHGAWDGYIHGKTLELEAGRRIVQSWRSTDFPLGHADSRLELQLLEVSGGTEVTIIHTGIPEGQGTQYASGWVDHYLTPMTKYFLKSGKPAARKAVARKAAAKKAAPKAPARKAKKAVGTAPRAPARKPAKKAPKARPTPASKKKSKAARRSRRR
jgi:uncharacterized protein YndB with AHSA1/START domain